MSLDRYLIETTIRVICDTHPTPSTLQEIQTVLESSIPTLMGGQIWNVSYSFTQLEVLH
jgi:hypothetical protein